MSFEIHNIDGFQIYVGKNNIQNDYITHKLAGPNDIWFHTQKIHGSHVLLKNPDSLDITEDILFKCACLAKENSKVSGLVKGCPVVRNIVFYDDIDLIKDDIDSFIKEETNEKHSNHRR